VSPAAGIVSLVGAGPGDPGLLTRRAVHRLRQADLVLYDALVPACIVELARRAQRFPVGKRAGRPSFAQNAINNLMIRAARRGRRVVRLKAGDPFVLGRGGEEALALRAAGVPFEIVPGLSSAFAAPALAGIPVTHRGASPGVLVISGHAESAWKPVLAAVPPGRVTVVVLMGLAAAAAIARALIDAGWPATTPAAVSYAAGTPEAYTWHGTLATLPDSRIGAPADAPGTIVIGEVVALSALIGADHEAAAHAAAGSLETHVSHG